MSRVGKRILPIPAGASVNISNSRVEVKGKLGVLSYTFSPLIAIEVVNQAVTTVRANDEKATKQLHGTTNALIANMLIGVTSGYKKELEIKGVGFRAALKGDTLEVNAGYSHVVEKKLLPGLKLELPKPTEIIISGIDKQAVGQMASLIRDIRRPSPYTGKGIMYKGELVRRKEGKAATK